MIMFKNDYQGGNFFEIFSAQGKDPTGLWKLQGGAGIRKIYEKEVKSFVYHLEGTVATTKMQLPKDLKQSLSLVQRYLIFQLNVPKGGEFSVEIGITDIKNNKRRLNMSTSVKDITATPLHAKLPLTALRKSVWVNCCYDMVNIVGETWPGQTFGKVDSLSISANCKLRRILTMKHQPQDTTDDDLLYGALETPEGGIDSIPRQHQLAADVTHFTQAINMHKIRAAEAIKIRGGGDKPSPIDLDLSASGRRGHMNDSFHIAFGTKIGKPPTAGMNRKSASSGLPSHRENMRASAGTAMRDSYDPSTRPTARTLRQPHADRMRLSMNGNGRQRLLSDPGKLVDINQSTNSPLNESKSWSGSDMQDQRQQEAAFAKPHPPPRDSSAESNSRRRPKVRSGERQQRTPADAHLKPLTNSNGHHHTVSAPSVPHHKQNTTPTEDNSLHSKLSPLKLNKLSPLDKRVQLPNHSSLEPVQHVSNNRSGLLPLNSKGRQTSTFNVNNHNAAVPVVWTSQSEETKQTARGNPTATEPWYQQTDNEMNEESVSDVIEALRGGIERKIELSEEDDNEGDMLDLMDSLEKFSKDENVDSESSEEDSSSKPPTLFQFHSPPKPVNRLNSRAATGAIGNAKKALKNFDDVESHASTKLSPLKKADRPNELSIFGSVYSPSAYKPKIENSDFMDQTPSEMVKQDLIKPRPPDSPRISSRPGSGRLRSRHNSRASNHSNKPTPESSGTGEELSKELNNHKSSMVQPSNQNGAVHNHTNKKQTLSPGSKDKNNFISPVNETQSLARLAQRNDLASKNIHLGELDYEAMPSPRTSDKEPRISSAGRRGGSANSGRSPLTSSGSASSEEDHLVPPHVQMLRTSDRGGSPVNSSRGSTRLSRKSLREIPDSDKRLLNAQYSSTSPTRTYYEPSSYQHVEDTFDEEKMLQFLKREQEVGESIDEHNNAKRVVAPKQYEHEVVSDGEHSSDDSFNTTSVPIIGAHDYHEEMQDTLERSDTRDLNVFSPPIIIASQRKSEEHLSATDLSLSHKKAADKRHKKLSSDRSGGADPSSDLDDDQEELDLLYDPVLNCYYDPKTHKYYELA